VAGLGDEIGSFGFCKERTSGTTEYTMMMAMLEE
jgi:hypothetical protein